MGSWCRCVSIMKGLGANVGKKYWEKKDSCLGEYRTTKSTKKIHKGRKGEYFVNLVYFLCALCGKNFIISDNPTISR